MMMRGKVGAFSYYVSETRQIVRQAQNNSNFGSTATRSPNQQSRRVLWANLVNFYSGNKGWMKKAFEDPKPGVSVFNRFMQLNIPNAKVALTKAQAASKMWVVSPYVVSQGSLPSPTPGVWNVDYATTIELASAPAEGATVAQISQAILDNNKNFLNGDAIVALRFAGYYNAVSEYEGHGDTANYEYYEFVINVSDTRAFAEAYPQWEISSDKLLRNTRLEDVDGYTYIHTRKSGGKLLVSTSKILAAPRVLENVDSWGSSAQIALASDSYNVETPVMLLPGGSTSGSGATDGGSDAPGGGGAGGEGDLGQ